MGLWDEYGDVILRPPPKGGLLADHEDDPLKGIVAYEEKPEEPLAAQPREELSFGEGVSRGMQRNVAGISTGIEGVIRGVEEQGESWDRWASDLMGLDYDRDVVAKSPLLKLRRERIEAAISSTKKTREHVQRDLQRSPSAEGLNLTSWRFWTEGIAEFVPQLALQAAAAMGTGGTSLPAQLATFSATGGSVEAGNAYSDARERLQAKGVPEDQAINMATAEAILIGAVSSAMEVMTGNVLLKKNPAAKAVFDASLRRAIARNLSRIGKGYLSEGGTEAAQEAWSDTVQWMVENDPEAYKDAAERYGRSFVLGGATGAAFAGAKAVADRYQELEDVRAKGFVTEEDGKRHAIPGKSRQEREENSKKELDEIKEKKQQESEIKEPPLAEGMTRLYHGSAEHGRYEGKAWFSTNREYAANYRGPEAELQYVDVPTEWVNAKADPDNYDQTPAKGYDWSVELDIKRRPLVPPKDDVSPPGKVSDEPSVWPGAVTGKTFTATGYRFGEPHSAGGDFYSESPDPSLYGTKDRADDLRMEEITLDNPLVVDGVIPQKELLVQWEKEGDTTAGELLEGDAGFDAIDEYIAQKAVELDHDGLVYRGDTGQGGNEVVDLRGHPKRKEAAAKEAEARKEAAEKAAEKEAAEKEAARKEAAEKEAARKAAEKEAARKIKKRTDLLPEGWTLEIGETRTDEGRKFEAEVDWRDKRILFDSQESMDDPLIVNHEIAHVVVEALPGGDADTIADLSALYVDYVKAKSEKWKDKGYEPEWVVKHKFHREEIAMDYGDYLSGLEVPKEVASVFRNHLPEPVTPEPDKPPSDPPPTEQLSIHDAMKAALEKEFLPPSPKKGKKKARRKGEVKKKGTKKGTVKKKSPAKRQSEEKRRETGKNLKERFDDFNDVFQTRPSVGIDPEKIEVTVKLVRAAVEHGIATFYDFVIYVIDKAGSDKTSSAAEYIESAWRTLKGIPDYEYIDESGSVDDIIEEQNAIAESLVEHFATQLGEGKNYNRITEARKEAAEILGKETIEPGSPWAKKVDEAVERGVVRAARNLDSFDDIVDLYKRQPNLSVRTSRQMIDQAYSTPAPLAYLANKLAGVTEDTTVYDSSAGNGMLFVGADLENVLANEINPDRVASLKALGVKNVVSHDATKFRPQSKFDAVIINPPFGKSKDEKGRDRTFTYSPESSGEVKTQDLGQPIVMDIRQASGSRRGGASPVKTQEIDHAIVMGSLKSMHGDGTAVLIIKSRGIEAGKPKRNRQRADAYSTSTHKKFYDTLYNEYDVVDHFTVSGGLYAKQGAKFPVDVIVIHGKGESSRPKPYNFQEDGLPEFFDTWEALKDAKLKDAKIKAVEPEGPGTSGTGEGQRGDRVGAVSQSDVDILGGTGEGGEGTAGSPGKGVVRPSGQHAEPDGGGGGVPTAVSGIRGVAGGKAQPKADKLPDAGEAPVRGGHRRRSDGVGEGDQVGKGGEVETEFQITYEPQSSSNQIDTLVPRHQVGAVQQALRRAVEEHGPLDEFVATELGYEGAEALLGSKHFAAEQIDALALSIASHKQGKAFILGDQTGVGKGRVAAGMIVYAQKQQLVPIFVTENPGLFADMIRDLSSIGHNNTDKPFQILSTNAMTKVGDTDSTISLPDGRVLKQTRNEADKLLKEAVVNSLEGKGLTVVRHGKKITYDAIFTTYKQLGPYRQRHVVRHNSLQEIAHQSFFIMDESHNAGGQQVAQEQGEDEQQPLSGARLARELLRSSSGQVFLSATYAKRPEVMDLYANTGMMDAVGTQVSRGSGENVIRAESALQETITAGGVPLQQVVSEMLVESGAYLRRERSYDGVEFTPKVVDVGLKNADLAADSFRSINTFDSEMQPAKKRLADALASRGVAVHEDPSTGLKGIGSITFSSILWNLTDQMLLALKAEHVANEAVEAWKNGKMPVIAVDNTMESALGHYLEEHPTEIGDELNLTFRDLLNRYLERSRQITATTDTPVGSDVFESIGARVVVETTVTIPKGPRAGNIVHKYVLSLNDQKIGDKALALYNAAKGVIRGFSADLPVSPIDKMRQIMKDAGMRIAEVTGRTLMVEYHKDGKSYLAKRPSLEAGNAGKGRTIEGVNNGTIDGIILNRSGATGLSIHASVTNPKEGQKPREMIIAQAAKNVDEFMQMLGRIHRTGQVKGAMPSFKLFMSNAPAETRPASVLVKKLASSNANVTASAKGNVQFDAPDILNKIGDRIVAEYMMDNQDLNSDLSSPVKFRKDGTPKVVPGIAKTVSGRMALASVADQKLFWDTVVKYFNEEIAELDRIQKNPLSAATVPLSAKTLESLVIFEGDMDSNSPFRQPASLEKMRVNRIGEPLTEDQVKLALTEFYGLDALPEYSTVFYANHVEKWVIKQKVMVDRVADLEYERRSERLVKEEAKISLRESIDGARDFIKTQLDQFPPGRAVTVAQPGAGRVPGIVIGLKPRSERAAISRSGWVVQIALASPDRMLRIPFNRLSFAADETVDEFVSVTADQTTPSLLATEDDYKKFATPSKAFEIRYIATGNILAGFSELRDQNGSVIFYTDDQNKPHRGVLLPRGFNAEKWQEKRPVVFLESGHVLRFLNEGGSVHSPDYAIQLTVDETGNLQLRSPKSRQRSGQYTTDKRLIEAMGVDFVSLGSATMVATVDARNAGRSINRILDIGALQTGMQKEAARAIVGDKETPQTARVKSTAAKKPKSTGTPSPSQVRPGTPVRQTRSETRMSVDEEAGIAAADIQHTAWRLFGVGAHIGSMQPYSGSAGFYKWLTQSDRALPSPEVVRVAEDYYANIAVIAHEIAHHLDEKTKITRKGGSMPAKVREEIGKLDYEAPEKQRDFEGWAEFLRRYLTEPPVDVNGREVPNPGIDASMSLAWFENVWLVENPTHVKSIVEFREYAQQYAQQSVFQRAATLIADRRPQDLDFKERWLAEGKQKIYRIKANVVDKIHTLEAIQKAAEQRGHGGPKFTSTDGGRALKIGGREVGRTSFVVASNDARTAGRMIPESGVQRGDIVYRTQGIELQEPHRGKGFGILLYLDMMASTPKDSWFFSGPMSPPASGPGATKTLERLSGDGLIELHWYKHPETGKEAKGGIHVSKITNKGRSFLRRETTPKIGIYDMTMAYFMSASSRATIAFEEGVRSLKTGEPLGTTALWDLRENLESDGEYDQAVVYALARHTVFMAGKKPGFNTVMDLGDAESFILEIKDAGKTDRFTKFSEDLARFNNDLLLMVVEAGGLSPKEAERMIKYYGGLNYFPLHHIKDVEDSMFSGSGVGFVNLSKTIKHRSKKGSGRQIIDPIDATVAKAIRLYGRGIQARQAHTLAETLDPKLGGVGGMGGLMDRIEPTKEATRGTVKDILWTLVKERIVSSDDAKSMKIAAEILNPEKSGDPSLDDLIWFADHHGLGPLGVDASDFKTASIQERSLAVEMVLSDDERRGGELREAAESEPDVMAVISLWRPDYTPNAEKRTVVIYMPDGSPVMYTMNQDLYAVSVGMGEMQFPVWARLLRDAMRVFKTGAVGLSTGFGFMNLIRDYWEFQGKARHTKGLDSLGKPPRMLALYVAEKAKKAAGYKKYSSALIRLYEESGGKVYSIIGHDTRGRNRYRRRRIGKSVMSKLGVSLKRPLDTAEGALQAVQDIIAVSDSPPRLADAEAAILEEGYVAKGSKWFDVETEQLADHLPEHVRIKAATAMAEATVMFKRIGRYGQYIEAFLPFSNAAIQSSYRQYRQIKGLKSLGKKDPEGMRAKRYLVYLSALVSFSVLYWMMRHDDEDWRNQDSHLRDGHWTWGWNWLWGGKKGNTYLKIPKPRDAAVIANVTENMLDAWYHDDARDTSDVLIRDFFGRLPHGGGLIKGFGETYVADYSYFRERDLTPEYIKELPKELQVTPYTSKASDAIGKVLGKVDILHTGPIQVQHMLSSASGGLYDRLTDLYDAATDGRLGPEHIPFLRGLIMDRFQARFVKVFYRHKKDIGEKLALEKADGKVTDETLGELAVLEGHADLMTEIRSLEQRIGKQRGYEYQPYISGLARQALGYADMESSPNPFTDDNAPDAIEAIAKDHSMRAVNHAGNKEKAKDTYKDEASYEKARQTRVRGEAKLAVLGLSHDKAQALLIESFRKKDSKGRMQTEYRGDNPEQFDDRYVHRALSLAKFYGKADLVAAVEESRVIFQAAKEAAKEAAKKTKT